MALSFDSSPFISKEKFSELGGLKGPRCSESEKLLFVWVYFWGGFFLFASENGPFTFLRVFLLTSSEKIIEREAWARKPSRIEDDGRLVLDVERLTTTFLFIYFYLFFIGGLSEGLWRRDRFHQTGRPK